MKQIVRISLLSLLVILFCSITMKAATNVPTIQIGINAPLRTTVEIMKPVALQKYTYSESTSHLFVLENYSFTGGAYFQMGINVPVGGKKLQVYYNNKTYMTQNLEYGSNLVTFFIPLTSQKSFMFYMSIY